MPDTGGPDLAVHTVSGAGLMPAEFREVIRLDPQDAHAHCGLGSVLSELGDLDGAITHRGETIRPRPDHGPAHFALAETDQKNGQRQRRYNCTGCFWC